MSRYGASQFASLLKDCVLWAPLSGSSVTTTAKTITANGNATQSTAVLDPWGLGRAVGYFDGYLDRLSIPACPDMVFTGDFTIEFYLKCGNQSRLYPAIVFNRSTVDVSPDSMAICVDRTDFPNVLSVWALNDTRILTSTTSMIDSVWRHVAISRSGSTLKLFINGISESTYTTSATFSFNIESWEIGAHFRSSTADFGPGYLSEMRFSNIARYTSNFTPSTTRFKPDINTKLLLHMYGSGSTFTDDPFIDYDEFPILPSGVTVTNNGTFTKTSLGNNKSVLNFDGSTNYITLSNNSNFSLGADYTVSTWFKLSNNIANSVQTFVIFATGTSLSFGVQINPSTNLVWVYHSSSAASNFSYDPDLNWHHLVIVRRSGIVYVYVDMVQIGSSWTESTAITISTYSVLIGIFNTANYMTGNIAHLMMWKDRALSQPEIKLLMNRTHPITGTGLMPSSGEYYRLS